MVGFILSVASAVCATKPYTMGHHHCVLFHMSVPDLGKGMSITLHATSDISVFLSGFVSYCPMRINEEMQKLRHDRQTMMKFTLKKLSKMARKWSARSTR